MTMHSPSPAAAGAPSAKIDPLEGTPYRVIGMLARGGMGDVLDAEHRALNKRVVVKVLREELADDPNFVDRLRVEAQSLAAISHPNIVSVSDFGQAQNGRSYIVMERLYGRTLQEELRARKAIPVQEAIGIMIQILAGLGAAHRLGIIHRDLKLDNVIICDSVDQAPPVVKVLDFSIVKVLSSEGSPPSVKGPICPTEQGRFVGTPRYVAPEQVNFQKVDGRADIYAAGILLYTLVAGRGPFAHHQRAVAILQAHVLESPAPPSHHANQSLPAELDAAILKALSKSPALRFQTADLFAIELARILATIIDGAKSLTRYRAIGVSAPEASASAKFFPAATTDPFGDDGDTLRESLLVDVDAPEAAADEQLTIVLRPPQAVPPAPPPPSLSSRLARSRSAPILLSAFFFSTVIVVVFHYLGIR